MEELLSVKEARKIYTENNKKIIDDSIDGFVVLKNIDKIYDNRVQAVYDFNLSVKKNEFIVLVGPSGCGKSTTLRMIAGLEKITAGYLYIDKIMANYLASKDRDIAMVFQNYALYPNMSVFKNIAFSLEIKKIEDVKRDKQGNVVLGADGQPVKIMRKYTKEEIRQKVFDVAEILDLGAYLDRKPKELSGGQMQRVALGRAIVRNAKLFLMDEPLSNLDAKLRVQMRSEIVKLHKKVHATTIYVTHDQTEAMTMADRIVIMNKGFIQQIGTPIEIYQEPANIFVATFIGNPPMNVFETEVKDDCIFNDGERVQLPKGFTAKYGEFVKERLEFFKKLKENADLTQEKELIVDLKTFLSSYKKDSVEKAKEDIASLVERLKELEKQKSFIRIDDDAKDMLIKYLDESNHSRIKQTVTGFIKALEETDYVIRSILNELVSSTANVKKEEGETKKVKGSLTIDEIHAQNLEKIDLYIGSYSEEINTIYLGIRPENIHLYDEFNGEKSDPFTAKVDFIELLGSEYYIHTNLFGKEIIFKLDGTHIIHTDEELKVCFDMKRIKIFDKVSGKNITAYGE